MAVDFTVETKTGIKRWWLFCHWAELGLFRLNIHLLRLKYRVETYEGTRLNCHDGGKTVT